MIYYRLRAAGVLVCKGGTCKLSGFGFVQDITDRNLYETVSIFFNTFHLYPLGL